MSSDWTWIALIGLVLLGLAAAGCPFAVQAARNRRRARIMAEPFPPRWEKWLWEKSRSYRLLPDDLREQVRQRTLVLAAEKRFEACGGLEAVTEEMQVLVLAQAALLILVPGSRNFFPALKSILLYPRAFQDRARRHFGRREGDEELDRGELLGESWTSGSLILAWDSVKRGAAGTDPDGINVVLHEFAHQIDEAGDGHVDGVPALESFEDYERWAAVFQRRFDEMASLLEQGREPLLDEYGATDPAEFFAVATEAFFATPRRMKREMADLYAELRRFYAVDPAAWER